MNDKALQKDAMRVLKDTSRTFYIPITFLQKELKIAVAAAYLMMRAIDEIEDNEHIELTNEIKNKLLNDTCGLLEGQVFDEDKYAELLAPYKQFLPEVTLRLGDWIRLIPAGAENILKKSTSEMAYGMAKWAKANWQIETKEDLDDYTYYVAGLVGVMLSDLWEWKEGIVTKKELAVGFGRGLQAVNILRNQMEDMKGRGVSFIPTGWTREELFAYTEENLVMADQYIKDINKRSISLFCKLPLAFAHKTLKALKEGKEKMSREEVEQTVREIQGE
ncbi:hypothetical protein MTP04_15780 [Lysinibacillus sp. PLM2]|nr:hypothetical protein MTP04_15780 [Lysinibacillus sp. PLM2]